MESDYLDMLAQISTFLQFFLVFFHDILGLLQFIGRMTISDTSGHISLRLRCALLINLVFKPSSFVCYSLKVVNPFR
jgi:hypothetical protein